MATWEDVERLALAMPETSVRISWGDRHWCVRRKGFVWERPLRRPDCEALGAAAPDGPILGARVEHLVAKEALLASNPDVFFTTPHFDGYAAVLARLDRLDAEPLEEVVVEAWLASAPPRLARDWLAQRGEGPPGADPPGRGR
ncbi:MAG: MmcQ/YjbR family DNA-binding protein [Solirubrobacteraceae bacterium]|nr:MmcQ/YjbR family DNA-binding protein [Solirubrobacteraceae bacterium]